MFGLIGFTFYNRNMVFTITKYIKEELIMQINGISSYKHHFKVKSGDVDGVAQFFPASNMLWFRGIFTKLPIIL
jgi:hypothetical protein